MKPNRIFRFLSSVRLAIPLMLTLTVAVGYGTIVESRYNTDMARLVVYHTAWFQALLVLLWINILCAALSRIPYKRNHTGFVITHIGLLTLLIGAMITNLWGIDGQLPVVEKQQSGDVSLPDLVLEVINRSTDTKDVFPVPRRLREAGYDDFKSINDVTADRVSVLSYLPFAKAERTFQSGGDSSDVRGAALSFRLKSQFFDVSQSLQFPQNPEAQMGPAHLTLTLHGKEDPPPQDTREHAAKPAHSKARAPKSVSSKGRALRILAKNSGKLIQEVSLSALRKGPVEVGPLFVAVTQVYEQAQVGGVGKKGGLTEGGKKGANPALELSVVHQGKTEREVIFSKYPTFTLHNEGLFGYTFRFVDPESSADAEPPAAAEADNSPKIPKDSVHARFAGGGATSPSPGTGGPGGNEIQFHVYAATPDKVQVKLSKGGAEVLSQWVKKGEMVQTPWMGMQITLTDMALGGVTESTEIKPTEQSLRSEMPPSALLLRPARSGSKDSFWLMEGDGRDITVNGNPYQVFYGKRTLKLPFQVYLDKFTKLDYPGTQTALSYESMVRIGDGAPIKISMNEPLTLAGYTLYQASYIVHPGEPPVSIFSVNWDPGR